MILTMLGLTHSQRLCVIVRCPVRNLKRLCVILNA